METMRATVSAQAARSTLIGSTVALLTRGVTFAGLVFGARTMGLRDFGVFSVVQTSVGLVVILGDAGYRNAAVQTWTACPDPGSMGAVLRHRGRIITAAAIASLLVGISVQGNYRLGPVAWLAIASLVLTAKWLGNVEAIFRVRERFGRAALLQGALPAAFGVGAALGGLLGGETWRSLAYAALIAAVAALTARAWMADASWPPDVGTKPSPVLRRRARHHLLIAASVALYSRSDRLIVGAVLGAAEAGAYTAIYNVVIAFAIVGAVLSMTGLPALKVKSEADEQRHLLYQLTGTTAVVAVVAAIVMFAAWSTLVQVATGGHADAVHVSSTRPLALLAVLYPINGLLTAGLTAFGYESVLSRLALSLGLGAPVLYVGLAFGGGLTGVAWGSVVVELVGFLVQAGTLRRHVGKVTVD